MLQIFGSFDTRDLSALSLADYTEDRAIEDVRRFANDYNRLVEQLESDLAVSGDLAKIKLGLGVGGEMQPYAEGGETEGTRRPEGWDVAFPIRVFRSRKIYTEQYLVEATLADLEKDVIQAAVENFETRRKMILRALMLKTNYTFDDGSAREWPRSGLGSLAVKRLVNNDSATGEVWVNGAAVSIGTLQHYFGSNNASVTQTPFETAYGKLKTVGQVDDVVARIAPGNETAVRGLTDFVPSQNTRIVDPSATYARVTSPKAIGRLEGDSVSCEIVVEPMMPTGYVFMNNRAGGPDTKPVRVRVHPLAQYRGFRLVQDETRASYGEASFRNKRWEYVAGAGVQNRVNGVAFQIVASTTYTDPTI